VDIYENFIGTSPTIIRDENSLLLFEKTVIYDYF
jgi:hypothetical protein